MPTRTEIRGLQETKNKLEQTARDIHGKPMVATFQKAVLLLTRDAKIKSPVDTGRLRSSITGEVFTRSALFGHTLTGIAGTNVKYAPYMEFGTGTFTDGEKLHGRPHKVPPKYLKEWARRHKANEYVISRAIFIRGGLKPRKFFQYAADQNRDKIKKMIEDTVSGIVRK